MPAGSQAKTDQAPEENAAVNLFVKIGAVTYVLWRLLHNQATRLLYLPGGRLEPFI